MKNMLWRLFIAMTMIMLLVPCAEAVSQQSHGCAFVPSISTRYKTSSFYELTHITISNITDSEVTCSIRVYGQDGTDATSRILQGIFTGSYTSGDSRVYVGPGPSFTLQAHQSNVIQLYTTSANWVNGYAIIDWTSDNASLGQALIGTVRYTVRADVYSRFGDGYVTINNGQPF